MLQTLLVFLTTYLAAIDLVAGKDCKCTADNNQCWPRKSEWDRLSATLSHAVFDVHQPGYYCHDPNFDAARCAEAQRNARNQNWIADQAGGCMSDNWGFNRTSWCFIKDDRTNPCGQGRVPAVGVNATSVQDVQNAMAFANQYNLKVVVKCSGHDFIGRGLCAGSMLIWTHFMKGVTYHPSFIPQSSPFSGGFNPWFPGGGRGGFPGWGGGGRGGGFFGDFMGGFFGSLPRGFLGEFPGFFPGGFPGFPAMTVQSGTQWFEAYKAADDNGVTIGGAIAVNGTVCAGGGYALGAGHNILSPFLGLAADNLLEISVVLPNASFVTANAYQHTDLFWAIRGGGGPSFGIATSMTFKVNPQFPLYAVFFEAITNSSDAYVNLLDSFFGIFPLLAQSGWSGYAPLSGLGNYFALMYLLPWGNARLGNYTLGPWINRAAQIPGVTVLTNASKPYPNFGVWVDQNIVRPRNVIGFNYATTALGTGNAAGSLLLPRDLFDDSSAVHKLSQAMAKIPGGLCQHVGGGLVSMWPPDINAVHSAWRTALINLVVFNGWQDGTPQSQIQKIFQDLSGVLAPVRALTPDNPAQYLNEPDLLVPDFIQANWGYDHYDRLLEIKKEIDPNNMLLVRQGVNSVGWDDEQVCTLT